MANKILQALIPNILWVQKWYSIISDRQTNHDWDFSLRSEFQIFSRTPV